MNKDFYISLITKKLSNELNAAELKDLSTWLSESKANAITSGQFKQTWDLTKDYKSSVSFDAGTAFQSFAKKYEIPTTTKVANTKPKSKLGVKKYILLFSLLMLTSAFIGALIFNSVFKGSDSNSIANNEMHAQTFALNDAINVTVAPNSRFEKGVYTIQRKDISTGNDNAEQNLNGSNANTNSGGSGDSFNTNLVSQDSNASTSNMSDYTVENFYGQGYFDVNVPAGMQAAKIEIEDNRYIETENATFNLQNYEEDDFSVIDVQTGSIKFVAGENILNITEGQRLIYNEKSGNYKTVKLPELNPFKWHKGVIVFDNTPLEEAFSMIERFYGVDINITDDSSLDDHNFTVTLYKGSTVNDCLELLSESIPMKIERVGERDIEVSDVKKRK
jgi:hypothetical protein